MRNKSYYDTKNKDDYIHDGDNLEKIRSKNLRKFCEFVLFMEEVPFVVVALASKEEDKPEQIFNNFHSWRGAYKFLEKKKQEEMPDAEEIKKLASECGKSVKWIERRTAYDYMNAYKFVKACHNRADRMISSLVEGISHNETEKKEKNES